MVFHKHYKSFCNIYDYISNKYLLKQQLTKGGLSIPYSEKRFPGYDASEKKADPELLAGYIYGSHITEYMEYLQEEDDEMYQKQFASYIADGIEPDAIEGLSLG